jgi:hypothetical protein
MIFHGKGSAQTWPMPGAQWVYSSIESGFHTNFAYTKDTLINTTNYQVIEHTNPTTSYHLASVYTRYSNDTVFRYVQSKEYPFIVFSAQPNDHYQTFRPYYLSINDTACSSNLTLKVEQLDTVNMAGLNLQRWVVRDTLFDDLVGFGNLIINWEIVQRIGFINNFPFIPKFPLFPDCSVPSDGTSDSYLCEYSDNTFSYNVPCAVGINDQTISQKINLYPNPANDVLNISASGFNTYIEIHVANLLGQKIDHFYIFNEKHNYTTANLPAGFYFLTCSSSTYTQTTSFIINR